MFIWVWHYYRSHTCTPFHLRYISACLLTAELLCAGAGNTLVCGNHYLLSCIFMKGSNTSTICMVEQFCIKDYFISFSKDMGINFRYNC